MNGDRRNLGWIVAPWVLWPLAVWNQALAWTRFVANLRELRALGLLALGLLLPGCAGDAVDAEDLPTGPPLCACPAHIEVELEGADAGAPVRVPIRPEPRRHAERASVVFEP